MIQLYIILLTGLIFNNSYKSSHEIEQNLKPNFIVVFVDDMGYGRFRMLWAPNH